MICNDLQRLLEDLKIFERFHGRDPPPTEGHELEYEVLVALAVRERSADPVAYGDPSSPWPAVDKYLEDLELRSGEQVEYSGSSPLSVGSG